MNLTRTIILLSSIFLAGCSLFDRAEEIPAFLRVNSVELIGEGLDSDICFDNKVKNVEVFANGRNIGIYALGADIPIFDTGLIDVEIFPLVYFAGSSQILEPHLFLRKVTLSLDFTPGEVIEQDLTASYFDDLVYHINEDFEGNPFVFIENVDEDSLSGLTVEPNDYCSDNFVGAFHLTDSSRLSIVTTNELNQIVDLSSDQAYLEFDYLSDINLTISFYTFNTTTGEAGGSALYYVNPKNEWNRLYINMSDYIRDSDSDRLQMLIIAELPVLDEAGDTLRAGSAYLDNIRVISF